MPSKPAEEPPARRSTRASGTRSSSASAKRPREVATAPPPREEPKPVESPAPRASEPAATVAAPDHAEPPPAKSPDSAPAPKADPKPAETAAAPAKPQGSKWAHLMGDKAPNADDFLLLEQCKAAARRGDCTAAKAFGAELAKKNIAMYRARAETDSAIAACLRSK
ncbi:MAG TPA: hypothetical protein VFK02_26730 [Kofleriaceae bacterium]|nr:hypothetical protein [Kofleriaceae bacterium]